MIRAAGSDFRETARLAVAADEVEEEDVPTFCLVSAGADDVDAVDFEEEAAVGVDDVVDDDDFEEEEEEEEDEPLAAEAAVVALDAAAVAVAAADSAAITCSKSS